MNLENGWINATIDFFFDFIIHSCPYSQGYLAKSPLKLNHRWAIIFHKVVLVCLLIFALKPAPVYLASINKHGIEWKTIVSPSWLWSFGAPLHVLSVAMLANDTFKGIFPLSAEFTMVAIFAKHLCQKSHQCDRVPFVIDNSWLKVTGCCHNPFSHYQRFEISGRLLCGWVVVGVGVGVPIRKHHFQVRTYWPHEFTKPRWWNPNKAHYTQSWAYMYLKFVLILLYPVLFVSFILFYSYILFHCNLFLFACGLILICFHGLNLCSVFVSDDEIKEINQSCIMHAVAITNYTSDKQSVTGHFRNYECISYITWFYWFTA